MRGYGKRSPPHRARTPPNRTEDPLGLIDAIHARNMQAGVAISPDTPSTAITDEIAAAADLLLVMTVYPGRGGQAFLARCVPKVTELRARFPHKNIEVDGGVGPKTIDVCADAGSSFASLSALSGTWSGVLMCVCGERIG